MKKKVTRREDYLKLIHTLSARGLVRGADLASELDVSRPTVSVYLKQLIEAGDITMDRHHAVHLTQQGRAIAEATLEKHSVLTDLLKNLGVPEEIAVLDACGIEHNLSQQSHEALKRLLLERQESC